MDCNGVFDGFYRLLYPPFGVYMATSRRERRRCCTFLFVFPPAKVSSALTMRLPADEAEVVTEERAAKGRYWQFERI